MAKRKVRARPGALRELLKQSGMTQMDASVGEDKVDRKTQAKINRGDEVKLETLQMLARKLRIPVTYFFDPAPAPDETGGSFDPTDTVMLRKLNAERLAELIKGAFKVEWLLNVQVIDNKVRRLLQDLESAVHTATPSQAFKYDLSHQLSQLRAVDSLADLLQELGKHRLAVLGAEYLHWDRSTLPKKMGLQRITYTSYRHILLSVDPSSTQSRRVRVDPGAQPPKSPPGFTVVYVDGRELPRKPPIIPPRWPPLREIEFPEDHPFAKKRED